MDIWYCLKEQKKDKMHLLLGSKDISCLLDIKMKDFHVLPEVKTLFICWKLQPPDPPPSLMVFVSTFVLVLRSVKQNSLSR